MSELAAREPNPEIRELDAQPPMDLVKIKAAQLYGRGYTTPQIAQILLKWLAPSGTDKQNRLNKARQKLRRWKDSPTFRDLVYEVAKAETDMALPMVLKGVVKRAKRGRVDAARLVLELTGRHNPKGEAGQSVTIQIANVPRPDSRRDIVEAHASTVRSGVRRRVLEEGTEV